MPSTARRTLLASAGLVALAGLIATGCSSSSKSSTSSTTATPATTASGSPTTSGGGGEAGTVPSGTINGSGSTFQLNFNQDAIQAFTGQHSGVTINYAGGGSGKGQSDLQHNLVQFAG